MGNSTGAAARSESAKFERRKAILAKMVKNHKDLKTKSGDGFEEYVESAYLSSKNGIESSDHSQGVKFNSNDYGKGDLSS